MRIRFLPLCFIVMAFILQDTAAQTTCPIKYDEGKIISNSGLYPIIESIQKDSFYVTRDKKDIPDMLQKQLVCMSPDFKLANPDEECALGCVHSDSTIPTRQLLFYAESNSMSVLLYIKGGGIASFVNMVVIRYKQVNYRIDCNDRPVIDFWFGSIGDYSESIQQLRSYLKEHANELLAETQYIISL